MKKGMMERARRMRAIPPYYFASLSRRIDQLRAEDAEVIRLDIGSPDQPPANHIIDTLVRSARTPGHHGYGPFGGTEGFRQAVAEHYLRRFGVELDPVSQVLGLIGSKEGLFHITQAFVNPGDVVLSPEPGYPVYRTAVRFAGGEIVTMPLKPEQGFLPDFEAIPQNAREGAKLMWLNYPNNPTGATADLQFFARAIEFARRYDILICHDAPYAEVCYDGYRAPSVLEVEGSRQVAIEFNSLSKSHNMAGWRVGMAVGNPNAIEGLYTLKSQIDSSQFQAVLDAGEQALRGDQGWLDARNQVYAERRDIVLGGVRSLGMKAERPKGALYIWARLPVGFDSSEEFCRRILEDIHVSITPGVAFGALGEGYVRISLGAPTEEVRRAMERLADWRGLRSSPASGPGRAEHAVSDG